eukprot:scaffold2002_cov328-Prasinococcus_capsulatus_cf.AAC.3
MGVASGGYVELRHGAAQPDAAHAARRRSPRPAHRAGPRDARGAVPSSPRSCGQGACLTRHGRACAAGVRAAAGGSRVRARRAEQQRAGAARRDRAHALAAQLPASPRGMPNVRRASGIALRCVACSDRARRP